MAIQDALTKKVGPLPVWAYAVIAVGAAWLYLYARGGSNAGTSTGTGYPGTEFSDGSLVDESGSGSGVGGGGNAPTPTGPPASNQSWYSLASTFLIGFGYDGLAVADALGKYLSGLPLSVSQRALVSQAIARYGIPPEGVPPSEGETEPEPTPGPPGTPTPTRPPIPRKSLPNVDGGTVTRPPIKFPGRPRVVAQ